MAYNFPYKSYPEAGDAYDYFRQANGRGRVVVNPRGSKLEREILTRTADQAKLLQQIKELEGMTACAGIRNNISAAYKARVNHYGGVSSWGMLLPIRRWVDSAYSDTTVGFTGVVKKNFQGRNSKALAYYIASKLHQIPRGSAPVYSLLKYDEWAKHKFAKKSFEETTRRIEAESGGSIEQVNRTDDWQVQKNTEKRNRKRFILQEDAWNRIAARDKNGKILQQRMLSGGYENLYNVMTKDAEAPGLFGMTGKGKPYWITPKSFMKGLAAKMAANQRRAIRNMTPPNTPVTEAIKGKNSPLIWTGAMLAAVESWVDE